MPQLVSVHQPNFLPWVKLLDKILASDVYVAYDTVQFTKSEYHARQKIKRPTGSAWLTVPVLSGGHQNIEVIRIDHRDARLDFRRKHLAILAQDYRRTPYFKEVYALVEEVYARDHKFLVELNVDLIQAFCDYLGADTRIVRASALPHDGDNTQRLIQLVQGAGGDAHLTSTWGTEREYIDWPRLTAAGIPVYSQGFSHPVYAQSWGNFAPNLSALDMLFNCGPETADILGAGRRIIAVPEQEG